MSELQKTQIKQEFDVEAIKLDFPIFNNVSPYGKRLIYLDNAASAQKPLVVLEGMKHIYENEYANVHRGLHYLANKSTEAFEKARAIVQKFLGAKEPSEIIWTSGATEGINLVAHVLSDVIQEGDEIILSIAEHHSNIVPWHFLREKRGAVLRWINLLSDGSLDIEHFKSLLNNKTKIVTLTHMSNILGTINPIKEITQLAKSVDAYVMVDGSQAAVHMAVDVAQLGVDFYVITGHKLYGPTGIGAVYIKSDVALMLPPYKGGGEMIDRVTTENVTYNIPPHRFEAGTPPIVQAIGLGFALEYIQKIGFDVITPHENMLRDYLKERLLSIDNVSVYGTVSDKGSLFAFNIKDIHPHDMATYLDRQGVAIRAGHHCGQPLMDYLGIHSTARASLAMYNTKQDIDDFIDALEKAVRFFKNS